MKHDSPMSSGDRQARRDQQSIEIMIALTIGICIVVGVIILSWVIHKVIGVSGGAWVVATAIVACGGGVFGVVRRLVDLRQRGI